METTTPTAVLAVSRRPWLHESHLESASRFGPVLYERHESGSFADAVNRALGRAAAPVVLKVDDHDTYPDDHGHILDLWEPGVLLHGVATFVGCDGQKLGRRPSLCASAFPSGIRVTPNRYGQITGSVRAQCKVRQVETEVRKLVCPGDWSWGRMPGTFGRVNCDHYR